jgi:hypothetical protein
MMVRNSLMTHALAVIAGFYFGRMSSLSTLFGIIDLSATTQGDPTFPTEVKAVNVIDQAPVNVIDQAPVNFNFIDADGWKTVHVFYGAADIMPVPTAVKVPKMWVSQVGQDKIVFKLLGQKKGGYFIDLAANDPMWLSNSYALETHHDWRGLCIEGNPYLLDGLSFRKCHVVGAVVSKNRLEKISYATRVGGEKANQAPLGGIIGPGMDNEGTNVNDDKEVTVTKYTVSLLEIFERFNVPKEVDYFSLDVEGAESLILSTFPLDSYSFKILTIERPKADAKKILESYGYVCLKKIGGYGETLWAKRSAIPGLDLQSIGLSQEVVMAPDFHSRC